MFLTHTFPVPPVSGERIRSFNLMRQLRDRDWSVSLFSLVGDEPSPVEISQLEDVCDRIVRHRLRDDAAARSFRLATAVARGRAFQSRFFYDRAAAREAMAFAENEEFDVLVAGQLYMYPYVPTALRRITILDAHNVELDRVESIAAGAGITPRGLVARLQHGPVATFEAVAAASVARLAAVSQRDAGYFEQLAPGRVDLVPNGVDCAGMPFRPEPGPRRLLFLGSLDYSANLDGIAYVVRQILPRMRAGEVELELVGSNPPRSLKRIVRESPVPTTVVGFVTDTGPSFARARMLLVPLRFGGGTRLKILEALARGTPVVTTSVGCAGLDVEDGRHLLVADEAAGFGECIDRLLTDHELCIRLAGEGRALVEQKYDWKLIGEAFERAARTVAGGSPRQSR